MSIRFGFVPVVPPFVGAGQDEKVVAAYVASLAERGGERWDEADIGGSAPLLYLMATGGTEGTLMRLRERRSATDPHEPVFLVAHPGNNSLPASLEVLARLQQLGMRGRILYLAGPDDEAGLLAVDRAVEDLAVGRALRSARIGMIGDPSDWLVASMPDAEVVRRVWGPEVVTVPLADVTAQLGTVPSSAVAEATRSLVEGAEGVVEPAEADLDDASRVYVALKALAEEHSLDALSVRCFDLVVECKTTGCFGLAELTDGGVIAGCEGDVVSTLGLLWSRLLTGRTPWMANPSRVDERNNTLWLAHCTVPRGIVERYRLRSHFESGLGVGIQGDLAVGPVTLLRLGGAALDRIWLAEGEVTKTGAAEDLCRTQAFVRLTHGHVSELLEHPLGNHTIMIAGRHAARLRSWFERMV